MFAFLGGTPGAGELVVLFLVILVLFGPRRLPEIARMIGKTLNELRRASQDFRNQIMTIDEEPVDRPADTLDGPYEDETEAYDEGVGHSGGQGAGEDSPPDAERPEERAAEGQPPGGERQD